jgi:two-component system KDP operon response regulator KdpE
MTSPEVLVIDDEPQIQKLLEITLQTNDFKVRSGLTGKSGLLQAKNPVPDLILLDLGLPDMSGHEVLTELRQWYTKPVLILSVQSAEEDIVKALNNGANDYLVKPFRSGELVARVRSALRGVHSELQNVYRSDDLEINLQKREVLKNGETVKLTSFEFRLLELLLKHEGSVLTHIYLLKEIWGPAHTDQTQYLRVFIAQLRKKIEPDPNKPAHILTESGVGYRFVMKNH